MAMCLREKVLRTRPAPWESLSNPKPLGRVRGRVSHGSTTLLIGDAISKR